MTSAISHNTFMARAIELAKMAEGRTRPNPMVGCVIVRDAEIVAEGYHKRAGEPHAEIEALRELDGSRENCTLYVNLEPCSYYGRTPPCADAIVESGIRRVVVGTIDPNPKVSGTGIRRLREAGIEVVTDVLEEESRHLNRAFFNTIHTGRPWVAAKYAMTLDGRIATRTGSSAWITNDESRSFVHELRDRYDAILVGRGTLIADDPRLSCRMDGGRDPVRVILDTHLTGSEESSAYLSDVSRLVFTGQAAAESERAELFRNKGVEVIVAPLGEKGLDLDFVMKTLAERELLSVLVEGGAGVLGALFDLDLVDYVYAFVAPKIVGGVDAPSPVGGAGVQKMAEAVSLDGVEIRTFGTDVLIEGIIRRGEG